MSTLTIRHLVPFGDESEEPRQAYFSRWLPAEQQDALTRETADCTTRLWFDRSCIGIFGPSADDEISHWPSLPVSKVYVDVMMAKISDSLAQFIRDERDSPRGIHYGITPDQASYRHLQDEYLRLGATVLEAALATYNRFVAFVRNHKGQYWLPRRPHDHNRMSSLNNEFRSVVNSGDDGWVRWCPPHQDELSFGIIGDQLSIRRDDWSAIQNFISHESRPELVLELLANAELLAAGGYRRSAIIEASAALERAVTSFSKSPRFDTPGLDALLARVDVSSLKAQVEHLGFHGTVRYLLPLIFPEDMLATPLIKQCQTAVDIRNNVAHGDQRDISADRLRPLIAAVRDACQILMQYTE